MRVSKFKSGMHGFLPPTCATYKMEYILNTHTATYIRTKLQGMKIHMRKYSPIFPNFAAL